METAQHKIVNRPAAAQPAASVSVMGHNYFASALPVRPQASTNTASLRYPGEKEADDANKIMPKTLPRIGVALTEKGRNGIPSREQGEKEGKEEGPRTKMRSPYVARFADSGIYAERTRETVLRKAEGQRNVASRIPAETMAPSSPSERISPDQPAGSAMGPRSTTTGSEQKALANMAGIAFDASQVTAGQVRQNDGAGSTLLGRIAAAPKSSIQAEALAQAQMVNNDCISSELQVSRIAAARRQQISTHFSGARQGLWDFFTRSVVAVQTFIAGKQAEIISAVTRTYASIRAAITGTLQAAQALAGQIRARINQMLESISTSVHSRVEAIAGRITGLIDSIPLPDMPGIGRIRAAAVGLLNRAAGRVNRTIDRFVDFLGWTFNAGMHLLDSFLDTMTQWVDMALSPALSAMLSGMQMIGHALNRAVGFIGATLRGALHAIIIPILNSLESLLTKVIGSAEQRAIGLLRMNSNQYLSSLAEAVTPGAAPQGPRAVSAESPIAVIRQLGRDAVQNHRWIVQTFEFIMGGVIIMIAHSLASAAARIIAAITWLTVQVTRMIVTAVIQAIQTLSQLVQTMGRYLGELIRTLTEAVVRLVERVQSVVQGGADQLIQFAQNGLRRIGSFIRRFVQDLILGRGVSESLADAVGEFRFARGPIVIPRPGPITIPALVFRILVILASIGAMIVYAVPQLLVIVSALVSLGFSPSAALAVLGVIAIVVLLLLFLLLYLFFRWLTKPKPIKPCPVPVNYKQTKAESRAGGVLYFEYHWDSSTGNLADLKACQVGEHVSYPGADPFVWPSPPWDGGATPNPTVRWHPGTWGGIGDTHSTKGFKRPYKRESFTATQHYRYQTPCANSGKPVVLMGPIYIARSVREKSDGNFNYTITKSGKSATIDPLP